MDKTPTYVIEMLHITKEFPGIKANDDITLQLKKANGSLFDRLRGKSNFRPIT